MLAALIELRKAHGWRQRDLAERANISVRQIRHLERGHNLARLKTRERICQAFGLECEKVHIELFGPLPRSGRIPKRLRGVEAEAVAA